MNIFSRVSNKFNRLIQIIKLKKLGLDYRKIYTVGFPEFNIKGKLSLDGIWVMVNTFSCSTLGINRKCKITVYPDALLEIKGRISMSNTAIVCTKHISIGANCMIGGGVTIVDSDFHSMNPIHWNTPKDEELMKSKDVIIGENVFIGMNSIILKGVTIGDNSILAAGSVLHSDVPTGEVWGGNPAKYISKNKFYKSVSVN